MTVELRVILVGEDDPFLARLRRVLTEQGVRSEESGSLEGGLEALACGLFDCALVDLSLAEGDELALLGSSPELPVVFLSGGQEPRLVQAFQAGNKEIVIRTRTQAGLAEELVPAIRQSIARFSAMQASSAEERLATSLWERELLQRQLLESSELFNHAPIGYLTLDRSGQVLEANDAACNLLVYPRHILLTLPLVTCLARESMKPFLGHLWRLFRGEDAPPLEVLLRQGTRFRSLLLSALSCTPESVRMALTEQTRLINWREALAVSRSIRGLPLEVEDALLEVSRAGVVQGVNEVARTLWSGSQLVGRALRELLPEVELEPGRRETMAYRADGEIFRADVSVTSLTGEDGPWLLIVRDLASDWPVLGRLLSIAESERRRLGQELHDNLGQRLAASTFLAGTLARRLQPPHPSAEMARRLASLCQQATREARSLAHGLFPTDLETGGLDRALLRLGRELEQVYPVRCRLDLHDCGFAPGDPSIHVYRIVQEALHNAIRHGQARALEVRLVPRAEEVELSITDDGIGFTGRNSPEVASLGLVSLRHHCQMLGGRVELLPNSPTGVVVRCGLPFPQASQKS